MCFKPKIFNRFKLVLCRFGHKPSDESTAVTIDFEYGYIYKCTHCNRHIWYDKKEGCWKLAPWDNG